MHRLRITDVDGCEHIVDIRHYSYAMNLTRNCRVDFSDGDHHTVTREEALRIVRAFQDYHTNIAALAGEQR